MKTKVGFLKSVILHVNFYMIYLQLPFILHEIQKLHERDMTAFDLEDIIFITNKWDCISMHDDSSDEDEGVLIWNSFKSDLRNIWPHVKEKNIFRMNILAVITNLYFYVHVNVTLIRKRIVLKVELNK